MQLNSDELKTGLELPGFEKTVTQEEINLYARASGDFNPIHIDPEFAGKTAAGGTIAHGMLVLAWVSRMMTAAFGLDWLQSGHFNVRFKMPARPGDSVAVTGSIKKIQEVEKQAVVSCDVLVSNKKKETVITGEAIVRISK